MLLVNCGKPESNSHNAKHLNNTAVMPSGYNGNLQGTVLSDGNISLGASDNIEDSINNASLGKLWLVFPAKETNETVREELPSEAMVQLNALFKYRLNFCLTEKRRVNGNGRVQGDMNYLKEVTTTTNNLRKMSINTPDGNRKISQIEADKIIEFVLDSGFEMSKSFR